MNRGEFVTDAVRPAAGPALVREDVFADVDPCQAEPLLDCGRGIEPAIRQGGIMSPTADARKVGAFTYLAPGARS